MRRRLTLLVAATTSVVLLAFLIPVAVLTADVAQSSALRRALAQSQSIVAVAGTGSDAALQAAVSQVQADGLQATVYRIDGTRIGTNAPHDLAVDETLTTRRASVRTTPDGGKVILQPVFGDDTQVVRVVIPPDQLNRGVQRSRTILIVLALVLFIGCVLVADLLARSLTRPLDAVGAAAERLARGDLDTRVEPEGTHETREIAVAMNRLATRIGELLAAEREQVADLSHRLRTPITVLRLDVESLPDEADRARLGADVEELTRQVDDVIREARRVEREGSGASCDVTAVARDRVTLWQALAEEQERQVRTEIADGPLLARLTADDLGAAIDALLGNVVSHTPERTDLRVTVEAADDETVRVTVEDAGEGFVGVDPTARGHSDGGSTGLGLDIARRTALASGGSFEIGRSADLGGAAVTMLLGPPTL